MQIQCKLSNNNNLTKYSKYQYFCKYWAILRRLILILIITYLTVLVIGETGGLERERGDFKIKSISQKFSCGLSKMRSFVLQRGVQSLEHACQCRDANCRLPRCQKMKIVTRAIKICKRTTMGGGCRVCKNLFALSGHHAQQCLVST